LAPALRLADFGDFFTETCGFSRLVINRHLHLGKRQWASIRHGWLDLRTEKTDALPVPIKRAI